MVWLLFYFNYKSFPFVDLFTHIFFPRVVIYTFVSQQNREVELSYVVILKKKRWLWIWLVTQANAKLWLANTFYRLETQIKSQIMSALQMYIIIHACYRIHEGCAPSWKTVCRWQACVLREPTECKTPSKAGEMLSKRLFCVVVFFNDLLRRQPE